MTANGSMTYLTLAFVALILLAFIFMTAVGVHFWYWQHREDLKQDANDYLARRALGALGGLALGAVPVAAWLMRVVGGVPIVLVVLVSLVLLLFGVGTLAVSRYGSHTQVLRWLDTLLPTPQATVERWQEQQAGAGTGVDRDVPMPQAEDSFAWPEFSLFDRIIALVIFLLFFVVASLVSLALLPFSALIMALGAALALHGGVQLAQVLRARQWRQVPAVITRSELKSVAMPHQGKPKARFLPVIEYQYSVDNQIYTGQRISLVNDEYLASEPDAVNRLLRRYPVRATPIVYHHPRHPEQSVLRPEGDASARRRYGWYVMGGMLLILLGLGFELLRYGGG